MQSFAARFNVFVLVGAAAGLVAGLLLAALDVVDNPFWIVSVGIFVAAMALIWDQARAGFTEKE